jgi:uncharacterized protein (TIGR02452 family)
MKTSKFDPEIEKIKQNNVKVFKETTAIIKAGYYTSPSGKRVDLNMQPMIDGGRCYHKELKPVDKPKVEGGTTVMVERGDCLKVAERLVNDGYNPALLNFASAGHPGGGVEGGARAQEETICRRSTLTRSIYSFDAVYSRRYGYDHQDGNNYPISRSLDFSMVYSPEVTVFREAGPDYTLMEHPFKVGVITNAALNLNGRFSLRLTQDGRMPEEAKSVTRNKIRAILRVGLIKGHDSLVLGAFGCGAFHNPPREMAQLFKEVMAEEEFVDRYRLITFAILSDHNDRSKNLESFREVFEKRVPINSTRPMPKLIIEVFHPSNRFFEMEISNEMADYLRKWSLRRWSSENELEEMAETMWQETRFSVGMFRRDLTALLADKERLPKNICDELSKIEFQTMVKIVSSVLLPPAINDPECDINNIDKGSLYSLGVVVMENDAKPFEEFDLKPSSELYEEFDISEVDFSNEDEFKSTEVYRKGDLILYEHEDEDFGSSISDDTIRELFPEFEIDPQKYYIIEKNGEIYYE